MGRSRLATALCLALALLGCGTASPTPSPAAAAPTVSAPPSPSPAPTATAPLPPSPAPTAEPSPSASAAPTPVPPPGKVKVNSMAYMEMTPYTDPPFYELNVRGATVVSVGKPSDGAQEFTVVLGGGSRVKFGSCSVENMSSDWIDKHYGLYHLVPVRICSFIQGAPITVKVASNTTVFAGITAQDVHKVGPGAGALAPYLRVGASLPRIEFGLTPPGVSSVREFPTAAQIAWNQKSWSRLQGSAGKAFSRTYAGFSFFAAGIDVGASPPPPAPTTSGAAPRAPL